MAAEKWNVLEPGLALRHWPESTSSPELTLLRITPRRFDFVLCAASAEEGGSRTVRQWLQDKNLVAAINASMYWHDGETSTGLLTDLGHINNGRIHPEFGAFFVFHPLRPHLPQVDMVDRSLEKIWRQRVHGYGSVVQNYRLLNAEGENVWQPSSQAHSAAAVAKDAQGRIYFIFQHEPITVHELGRRLENLPLQLRTTMFVEGGVEASLAVHSRGVRTVWNGRYDNMFAASASPRPVPNILGIRRKTPRSGDNATAPGSGSSGR
ncbi:MAG: phosphodiester glycosidase family protein [Thermodesulfobacteriota bacterium]